MSAALIVMKLVGGRIWTWLSHRSFWQLVCMVLAGFALLQHFQLAGERRHSAKVEAQALKCAQGREADRKAYANAQAQAKAKNEAEVRVTEERYKRNNDAAVSSLNDRLARLRRELSTGGTAPAQGHLGQPQVSRADGAAGAPGSPRLCLSPEELLRAAENEERHDQLITLIEKQLLPQPPLPR